MVAKKILLYPPAFHASCLAAEVYAYLYQPALIHGERCSVLLFFYLSQGFVGRAIQLAFYDVYIVGCLHDYVDSAIARWKFHVNVEAHNLEYQV